MTLKPKKKKELPTSKIVMILVNIDKSEPVICKNSVLIHKPVAKRHQKVSGSLALLL